MSNKSPLIWVNKLESSKFFSKENRKSTEGSTVARDWYNIIAMWVNSHCGFMDVETIFNRSPHPLLVFNEKIQIPLLSKLTEPVPSQNNHAANVCQIEWQIEVNFTFLLLSIIKMFQTSKEMTMIFFFNDSQNKIIISIK